MPKFNVFPGAFGNITAYDLLKSTATLSFKMERNILDTNGTFFILEDDEFLFCFWVENHRVYFRRNNEFVTIDLNKVPDKMVLINIAWDIGKLLIECRWSNDPDIGLEQEVNTIPTMPPIALVKWARKENLLPIEKYKTEEDFRSKIHSCIISIQDKISKSGGYSQFWNLEYDGAKIKSRNPKRETEIHPTIHCLLADQALLSSFEVISEYKTGVGNLDFLVIGRLENGQNTSICIEFKNAHSQDLLKGITHQLPAYMRNCEVKYGVYCVLDYKGEWFDGNEQPEEIIMTINNTRYYPIPPQIKDPIQEMIRPIILNLAKPKSASK